MVPALRGALSFGIGSVEYVLDGYAIVEFGHETIEVVFLWLRVGLLPGLVYCLAAVK